MVFQITKIKNMARQAKLTAAFSVGVILLASCNQSFEVGEEVWVNVPADSSSLCDGYAVGEIDNITDGRYKVEISEKEIKTECNDNRLISKLSIGKSIWIPAENVVDYSIGEKLWEDKAELIESVLSLQETILSPKTWSVEIADIDDVIKLANTASATDIVEYYELFKQLIDVHKINSEIPTDQFDSENITGELTALNNSIDFSLDYLSDHEASLRKLKKIAKLEKRGVKEFLQDGGVESILLISAANDYQRLKNIHQYSIKQLKSGEIDGLPKLFEEVKNVEVVFYDFVSLVAKVSKKQAKEVKREIKYKNDRAVDSIKTMAIQKLKELADPKSLVSLDEADEAIETAKDFLKPYEDFIGETIYKSSDYKRLYKDSIRENIKRQKEAEKQAVLNIERQKEQDARDAEQAEQRAEQQKIQDARNAEITKAQQARQVKLDSVKDTFMIGQTWDGTLRCRQYGYNRYYKRGANSNFEKLDKPAIFSYNYLIQEYDGEQTYKGIFSFKGPSSNYMEDKVVAQFYFNMKVNYDTKKVNLSPAGTYRDAVIDDDTYFNEFRLKFSGNLQDDYVTISGKNHSKDPIYKITCDLFNMKRTDTNRKVAAQTNIQQAHDSYAAGVDRLNQTSNIAVSGGSVVPPSNIPHNSSTDLSIVENEYDDFSIRDFSNAYSLAKSEKNGVDIMAISKDGNWCHQSINLKVNAKNKAIYFNGTLARYINHIGSTMGQHCAQATNAKIWGYVNGKAKPIYYALSQKVNGWKVDPQI